MTLMFSGQFAALIDELEITANMRIGKELTLTNFLSTLTKTGFLSWRRNGNALAIEKASDNKKSHTTLQSILSKLEKEEKEKMAFWEKSLCGYASRLSTLASLAEHGDATLETEAVDIAIVAWKTGSIECMKKLHSMAINIYETKYEKSIDVDYISIWWDGIGDWRCPLFER